MSIQENCRVVENTRLGEGLYLMVLDAPEIVELTQCGQFVHIACGEGHLLRRPISICTWQGSHLRIVFQVKGDGTKWLSERKVGDVLDVLGPLGHGFDVQALGDRPIFIGGGIGGSALSVKARADVLMRIRDITGEVLSRHTGMPLDRVFELTAQDTYFEAEDAIEAGLADAVIASF